MFSLAPELVRFQFCLIITQIDHNARIAISRAIELSLLDRFWASARISMARLHLGSDHLFKEFSVNGLRP